MQSFISLKNSEHENISRKYECHKISLFGSNDCLVLSSSSSSDSEEYRKRDSKINIADV